MKIKVLAVSLLFIMLIMASGCGISKENAMKAAEGRVEEEFRAFSTDIVSYDVKATEATKSMGNWNIMVNVTLVEKIGKTDLFSKVDGYYMVKVDSKGKVISADLKKLGEFRP